jgi:hypothetical protein
MIELSLHILDLVQNSLRAKATEVKIQVQEDLKKDLLTIMVGDNGHGMPPEIVKKVIDPFFTTRAARVAGLGVPLLKEATERCGGHLEVHSAEGEGTQIIASFQLGHLDRAPLGDLGETLAILITGNPLVDFFYDHRVNGQAYRLDTREMREILGTEGLEDPSVFAFIRQDVQRGLKKIGAASFPPIPDLPGRQETR